MKSTQTRRVIGWVLSGLVAAALAASALAKMAGVQQMRDALGSTGYENTLFLLGAIELLTVILFLIPATRAAGTLAIIAYLGGVIAFEWGATGSPVAGVLLSVLFWAGTLLREPHLLKR